LTCGHHIAMLALHAALPIVTTVRTCSNWADDPTRGAEAASLAARSEPVKMASVAARAPSVRPAVITGSNQARDKSLRSGGGAARSEEHTSELQSRENLVCRL